MMHVSDKFKYPIVSLAISPMGDQIAFGCEARDLHGDWQGFLYDGKGQTLIKKLPSDSGRTGYIQSLDYSPDGKWLAQATFGAYAIWDAQTGNKLCHIDAYGGSGIAVKRVRFSPDGNHLAAHSTSIEPITIWKPLTGELVRSFAKIKSPQNGIAFSPQSSVIALASEDRNRNIDIHWLDADTGEQLQKLRFGNWTPLEAMAFSSDGQLLAAGSDYDDPVLRVYSQA